MKVRITIEVEHVVTEGITDADIVRAISWAASKATADDGDIGSEEMVNPSRLWMSYSVEVVKS